MHINQGEREILQVLLSAGEALSLRVIERRLGYQVIRPNLERLIRLGLVREIPKNLPVRSYYTVSKSRVRAILYPKPVDDLRQRVPRSALVALMRQGCSWAQMSARLQVSVNDLQALAKDYARQQAATPGAVDGESGSLAEAPVHQELTPAASTTVIDTRQRLKREDQRRLYQRFEQGLGDGPEGRRALAAEFGVTAQAVRKQFNRWRKSKLTLAAV